MTAWQRLFGMLMLAGAVSGQARAAFMSDPTQPYTGSARYEDAVPRGPVLQSTRVSAWQKVAVISGRAVAVGDTVDGAIVADIRPYEVVLKKDGRETTLRMLPRLDKKPR